MHSNQDDNEISLIEIVLALKRRARILILVPLTIGIVSLAATFLITPTFTASTQLLPPQQQQGTAAALLGSLSGLAGGMAGAAAGLKNPGDQWVGLLKSRTVADALIQRFNLKQYYEKQFDFETRAKLEENSKITSGKDSLIDIEVVDKDPKLAAELANAYVEELQKLTKILAISEASQRRLYFESQLKEAKENLIKAETELRLSGVSASALKTIPEVVLSGIAELKARIATAEVNVDVLRSSMTANSPAVKQANAELSSLRQQLRNAEASDIHSQGAGAAYVQKYRNFKYYEVLFEMMAKQYELARADEAKDGALIQVVDAAQVPEWKSAPKRGVIALISTILTLLLTVLYVLIEPSLARLSTQSAQAT
jgi:tyrosine-protein kinase Etk/Wzc